MVEYLGRVLAALPGWLFLPVFIVIAVVATVVYFFNSTHVASLKSDNNSKRKK